MNVTCVPLTEFVHGHITAREGRPIDIDSDEASDLERAGLVRIQAAPAKKEMAGNVLGDGAARTSLSSPAVQVLHSTTLHLPKGGAIVNRKVEK